MRRLQALSSSALCPRRPRHAPLPPPSACARPPTPAAAPPRLLQVLQALDQIRDLLQGDASASQSFFDNLGIYLTLERAQRLYGFDAQR